MFEIASFKVNQVFAPQNQVKSTLDELATIPSDRKIEAYQIEIRPLQLNNGKSKSDQREKRSMLLKCKSCTKLFDSTFTEEEFAFLPKDQNESGTLHLCPHCGQLAIYLLEDYIGDESSAS